MPAADLWLCDPRTYFEQFLSEGIYPDGRSVSRFRPITLQMGVKKNSSGSSVAKQGGATVTCEVVPFLSPLSDTPIIKPLIRSSRNVSQEIVKDAVAMVNQLVAQEAFIGKDDLKTANGRLTWILHLHIVILKIDGAIYDVLMTCIAGALIDLRLPDVYSNCDPDVTIDISQVLLSEELHHVTTNDILVASSFIIRESSNQKVEMLCDPLIDLYKLMPNKLTIVIGKNERVYRIMQSGKCHDGVLRRALKLAIGRQKIVEDSLSKAKEAYLKRENDRPSLLCK